MTSLVVDVMSTGPVDAVPRIWNGSAVQDYVVIVHKRNSSMLMLIKRAAGSWLVRLGTVQRSSWPRGALYSNIWPSLLLLLLLLLLQ
jgi:hypothetical protein